MSKIKKRKTYEVTPHQMGDLLDEFNALKRMLGCLHQHGDAMINDLNEVGFIIPHLAEIFNFRPQVDPDREDGNPDASRDFVFSADPRAYAPDESDETDGDLH